MTNCSSLYFSNAGPSSDTSEGSLTVKALMSVGLGKEQSAREIDRRVPHTVNHIYQLFLHLASRVKVFR